MPVVHANKSHADVSYKGGILGLGKALVLVIQHGRRDVSYKEECELGDLDLQTKGSAK